jgi:hypothetical protein
LVDWVGSASWVAVCEGNGIDQTISATTIADPSPISPTFTDAKAVAVALAALAISTTAKSRWELHEHLSVGN